MIKSKPIESKHHFTLLAIEQPGKDSNMNVNEIPVVNSKVTLRLKCFQFLRKITIEPLMFLIAAATNLSNIPKGYLFLEKICQNEIGYSKDECRSGLYNQSADNSVSIDVHKSMASWNIILESLLQASAVCMVIIFGSWSDKYSRKIPLMVPLACFIATYGLLIVNVYFFSAPVYFLILSHIPVAIAGQQVVNTLAISYVAEIGRQNSLTIRLVIALTADRIGSFCTKYVSAKFYELWGYYSVFTGSILLIILAWIYLAFQVSDPPRLRNEKDTKFSKKVKEIATCNTFTTFYRTIVKKRPQNYRKIVWLLIFSELIICVVGAETETIRLLLAQFMLKWDLEQISIYDGTVDIIEGAIAFVTFIFILKVFKGRDQLLGTVLIAISLIGYLILALARNSWMFYIGPCLTSVLSFVELAIISIGSVILSADELGKVISFIYSMGKVTGIVSSVTFHSIYRDTLSIFPGFIFLLKTIFLIIPFLEFVYFFSCGIPVNKMESKSSSLDMSPLGISKEKKEETNENVVHL